MKDRISLKDSNVTIEVVHKDGTKQVIQNHNSVVNTGLSQVAGLIGGIGSFSDTYFKYMAIGTGTTTATVTQTLLVTPILSAQSAGRTLTTTNVAKDTCQFTTTFSFTTTYGVTEIGIFTSSDFKSTSSTVMLARDQFPVVNVSNGSSIKFTWNVIV